jgi:3',5'-cyclic AMP phosphodiesterase CpdA
MNETFVLAHLSDLHLSSLTNVGLREFLNKRAYGYLFWLLHRRSQHSRKVLTALLRDLKAKRPDHIVVTGDLTHLGLPNEFREADQWLRSLGPPSDITVIPGNHDAYVATPWDTTFKCWVDYMVSDETHLRPGSGGSFDATFPSLRVRDRTAIIGVSTARPCAPLFAVGTIGKKQLERVDAILEETRKQDLFRILLIHHPPALGAVGWRKRLTDGALFRSLVARHEVELVLHGHAHRTTFSELKTVAGRGLAIGVPSASTLSRKRYRRARYHICRLEPNPPGWDLVLSPRGYSPEADQFIEEKKRHWSLPLP